MDARAAVYAPDGQVYMVPNQAIHDALKNGGELAVPMKSPKGDSVWVHASQVSEAQKNGGNVDWTAAPGEAHEGFWKAYGSDLWGMVKSAPKAALNVMTAGATSALELPKQIEQAKENDQQRKAEGRSGAYRTVAAVGENLAGVNARGMEQAANEGDSAAILGHAAAAATPAVVGPVIGELAPKVAPQIGAMARTAAPAVKSAATTSVEIGAKVLNRDAIGMLSPRLKHAGSVLGKLAEVLRKGEKIKPGDLDVGPIPEEGSLPVTTPSDVPLEHIPTETAAPAEPVKNAIDYFAAKGDPKAIAIKQKIRATAEAARGKNTFADVRDDQTFQDAANQDLANHGRAAYAEARREFADRNSMDVPKWHRVAEAKAADVLEQAQKQVEQILQEAETKAKTPVRYTKTPPLSTPKPAEDLSSLLEKSIAAVKAKKNAQ